MSTHEDIAKAYVTLGVLIKKLQDERDEALSRADVRNEENEEIGDSLREPLLPAGIASELSAEVFGPLTVVEVVDDFGLLVAITKDDEYVLVYEAEEKISFYTRISSETLSQLRQGVISEREVLRHGETYRVQSEPVRYKPRKSELPTKEANFEWASRERSHSEQGADIEGRE